MIILALIIIFVLLSKHKRNKVLVNNFAIKKRKHIYNEHIIEKDEEEEDDDKKQKLDLGIWKKILKIMIRNKKDIIILLVAVFVNSIIDLSFPLMNSYAIEHYFGDNPDYSTRFIFAIMYFVMAVGMGICVWLFIRCAAKVEESTTYEIRRQTFDRLQKLSFSYYDTTSSGWVMARMTSDTRRLANIVSWGVVDVLWGIVLMFGTLIVTVIINWRLSLILLVLLPIFFVITLFYRKLILKQYRGVRKINSAITASMNESFMGANTTKTLAIEEENNYAFDDLTRRYKRRAILASAYSSLFWPSLLVLGYIGVAVISSVGGSFVLSDIPKLAISTATLYIFIDYAIRFFEPVMSIARIISDFQQAQASAERILSLIETEPDVKDTKEVEEKYGDLYDKKKENWEDLEGDIEFKNVTFRYKGTDKNVLAKFNLNIKKGQNVAFVGETGSGKSTIINLICRFYEPTEGEILIDGKNYKERSYSWLHDNLGYVLQTPTLFSGTIKENVRYGKLDATDEEIINACKYVNAHEFIEKLDDGYDTEIGEGGNKLSIGQKQLISFARAIIANPKILVLDEATSSIDTETEVLIQEAMKTVMKNRTCLVVAHRLSTVVNSDLIIVMREGHILESGTHQELLKLRGYYFNLYKNQFYQEKESQMVQDI